MKSQKEEFSRPVIRLVILGSFLTIINTIVATFALGIFQGFIVSFTTPFAFTLGRMLYPRMFFSATVIYFPVVVTSLFTLNFGPPGYPKILFLLSSIIYDITAKFMRIQKHENSKIPLYKLIIPTLFYPLGLLASAFFILKLFTFELPFVSQGIKGALLLVLFFIIMGTFAVFVCHRIYYRWLNRI